MARNHPPFRLKALFANFICFTEAAMFSSVRSWSKKRFLSTDYCFPVKIQSREHWWTVILAFQENGCWWNQVIMSVIMTDAVTEREDSSLLPAAALVTPHSPFTQLHQTHFKYVHIEKKIRNRLLASGKWVPLFAHSCLCSTDAVTWNMKLPSFHAVLTPCYLTQQN